MHNPHNSSTWPFWNVCFVATYVLFQKKKYSQAYFSHSWPKKYTMEIELWHTYCFSHASDRAANFLKKKLHNKLIVSDT